MGLPYISRRVKRQQSAQLNEHQVKIFLKGEAWRERFTNKGNFDF